MNRLKWINYILRYNLSIIIIKAISDWSWQFYDQTTEIKKISRDLFQVYLFKLTIDVTNNTKTCLPLKSKQVMVVDA